jgi:nitrogen regulatory protein PII
MISVVVPDKLVTAADSTSSGLAGEGKIFVSDVDIAVDISTGNRGRISSINKEQAQKGFFYFLIL